MALLPVRSAQLACSSTSSVRHMVVPALCCSRLAHRQRFAPVFSTEPSTQPPTTNEDDSDLSAADKKKKEIERLRAAEKFMVVGDGSGKCSNCSYEYRAEKGDPEFPIPRGVRFEALPEDYFCPTCGAPKSKFTAQAKVVAGFAENQGYGLGTNTWTGEQKASVIYGALFFFFLLFIGGYALE